MPSQSSSETRFTAEHEWVRVVPGPDGGSVLRLGITPFAAEALGDIVFVTLPEMGATLTAGQSLGEVESTKSVSDIYAPVAGSVARRNDQLETSPELMNSDPLGEGWLVELDPQEGADQAMLAPALLSEGDYQALVSG